LWGNELFRIQQIIPPQASQVFFQGVEIFCDVTNPLYGHNGAAYIFAKQKGADENLIQSLDEGLKHFSDRVQEQLGINLNFPGAGAAGAAPRICAPISSISASVSGVSVVTRLPSIR
jgi:glycerate kinase